MKNMENFRFLDWKVYKDTKIFCRQIIGLIKKLPKHLQYDLGGQLIRSATSILLNIAEGSGKHSDTELNRFFNIALGSAYETMAHLDFLNDNDFIKNEEFKDLSDKLNNICCQLAGFQRILKKR